MKIEFVKLISNQLEGRERKRGYDENQMEGDKDYDMMMTEKAKKGRL